MMFQSLLNVLVAPLSPILSPHQSLISISQLFTTSAPIGAIIHSSTFSRLANWSNENSHRITASIFQTRIRRAVLGGFWLIERIVVLADWVSASAIHRQPFPFLSPDPPGIPPFFSQKQIYLSNFLITRLTLNSSR